VHNAKPCFTDTIKGLIGNRPLRELTHNELYNAFKKANIELTNHAVMRLKDLRTKNLGFNTPNDIIKVINSGSRKTVEQTVKRNGKNVTKKTVEVTYGKLKVVFEKGTNKVITVMPNKI
jgi:filamentous hemagglutinin